MSYTWLFNICVRRRSPSGINAFSCCTQERQTKQILTFCQALVSDTFPCTNFVIQSNRASALKIYWLTERERYLCFVLASFQAMKDRFVTIRSVENNNGRRPLVGQLSLASRHPGGPPLLPTITTTLSYSFHPGEAFAHDLNITLFNF